MSPASNFEKFSSGGQNGGPEELLYSSLYGIHKILAVGGLHGLTIWLGQNAFVDIKDPRTWQHHHF